MNELALFAGAGGGILGGHLLGWRCVCAVEHNAYAASVLVARQNDGSMPPFPIWDDVCTFDGRPWRGAIDVVSGGFPCQDISVAGKGAGINGERSGLWREMGRIIGEVGPRYVLVENSPILTSRGLGVVLGDLAAMGYDARWGVLGAEDAIWSAGTPVYDHERERLWILATANAHRAGCAQQRGRVSIGEEQCATECGGEAAADSCGDRRIQVEQPNSGGEAGEGAAGEATASIAGWWQSEPGVCGVVHGMAHRVDRIERVGNGQVPAVVSLAWQFLRKGGS